MSSTSLRSAIVSGLPFYLWEVSGKPISIQLHFDAIDRMSPDILRGLGALKRRGAEVGGILLGRSEEGPPRRVIVEDFEPVPSEYLTGPSYNLSDNDLLGFEAALARRRSDPAAKISVVGFYRSHTRDELYMDDADLSLADRYFRDPGNVFLLIKPFATRPCIGGFFFWEDGDINRESTYLQFPFDRRELGGGEPLPAVRRQDSENAPEHAPLPPYSPPIERQRVQLTQPEQPRLAPARSSNLSILSAPDVPERRRPSLRWLLVPGVLFAAAAMFLGLRFLDNSKAPASSAAESIVEPALPLKLSVSERKNQLDVTWDRNAPAIEQAKRGVLSISDGANKRDLELSGAQLRNGRVLYSRLSGDVNLRLEVFPEGQPGVIESIRIVSTEAPSETAPPPPPAAVRKKPVVEKAKKQVKPNAARIPVRSAAPTATGVPAAQPEVELQRPSRRR